MNDAQRGEEALKASNYDEAIKHYTAALKQFPESPAYYIKRSTAYQRKHANTEALADADSAVVLATKRTRRELIGQAQLRRGIALFSLERYGDAEYAITFAKKALEKDNSIGIWEAKTQNKLKTLEEGDEKRKVTIKEVPDVETSKPVLSAPASTTTSKSQPATSAAPIQTPASQIRHEWYQNSSVVTVSVFAKGIPEDKFTVDIQERSLEIAFPLVTGSDYQLQLDPLFASIDPANSTYKLFKTKLDISLKKVTEGQKWAAIEGAADESATKPTSTSTDAVARSAALSGAQAGPAYPTSSKAGPKDWDKIMKDYTKPKKTSKAKGKDAAETPPSSDDEEDAEAEASTTEVQTKAKSKPESKKEEDEVYVDSDSDGGDEVNGFFKKLFKNADPDTRRAMMKSYQESGGTALSTNWDEVRKAPVAVSPPEGMEEKKY